MRTYRKIEEEKKRTYLKRKRKRCLRLVAVMLCVSLLVTACPYVPGTFSGTLRANAAQAADAGVTSERSRAADSGHTNHTGWTRLTSSTSTLTAGQNYYMESDVLLSSVLSISGSGTVNLCLNGYKLTKQYTSYSDKKTWLVTVPDGVTLNVYDCKSSGILGAVDNREIGGICVNGALNVYGGSICGQSSSESFQNTYKNDAMALAYTSAVYAGSGSVINLYGGSIEGKAATCVYVESGAKLTVDGAEVNNVIDCTSSSTGHVGVTVVAIYVNQGGSAEVKSGRVSATAISGEKQTSGSHNGSIAVMPTGSITISGGTVESTGEQCYGIYLTENAYWLEYVTVEKGTTYANISGGVINADVNTDGNDIEANMTGGEITGHIYLMGGKFKMDGSRKIGTASDEIADIVISRVKGLLGTLVLTSAMTNSSPYLVQTYLSPSSRYPIVFTENFTTYMQGKKPEDYFTSMDGYKVVMKDGECALMPYVMTFDANGGVCDMATGDINGGWSMRELPEPTRSGYTFDGWYTSKTAGDKITIDTIPEGRDITVYAHWTLVDYSISYDLAGGELPSGKTNLSSYTVETAAFTLTNPVRTGYTFTGWSGTALDGSANKTVSVAKGSTGNREFTANWSEEAYDITYNKNGGTIANENNYKSYTFGTGLMLPTPVRTGYSFGGWYDNADFTGTAVTEISSTEIGNKTFWAKWTVDNYTITYNLDGGMVSGNPESYTIESKAITLKNPTKKGYTFKGWSGTGLTGNHTSVTIASGSTGDRTYNAHWELGGYTVTLHTNGGSGGTALTSYTFGTGVALPENWTKTGYIFDGWYDNENCTGTAVKSISADDTGNKEYWAKWTDNIAPVIGTITYNYQPKNLWQWLMGKENLTITVPVTEEGSGADEVTYTMTPDGGTAKVETATIKNGRAEITVSADFKGTILIACTDKANNTSSSVIVGAGLGANGIIIEDNAPQIEFKAENAELFPSGEYATIPDITVTIADDNDNAVSGGIASVSYKIGDGSVNTIDHDYTTSMVEGDSFMIPASEIKADGAVISVTATDNAGNSITETYTVKVHTHSSILVTATEPTCTTAGNKEYYTCTCGNCFLDSGCMEEVTVQNVTIPAKGHTEVTDSAKAATCTETGLSEGSHCLVCAQVIKAQAVNAALGHDLSGNYQQDEKHHWKKCSRCEEIQPKAEHIYENDTDRDCNVCGYERTIKPSGGTGTVSKDVEKDEKAPDTTLSVSKEELADIILTEDEKAQIENGTDIKFILNVKDAEGTVSSGDKSAVREALSGDTKVKGFAVGQYLDISLFKIIGENRSAIAETARKLTLVIDVPDSLKSKDSLKPRTFAIVRVHGGVAEILEDLDNDADTITIATNRFSAYAIVYNETGSKPTVAPDGSGKPTEIPNSSDKPTEAPYGSDKPTKAPDGSVKPSPTSGNNGENQATQTPSQTGKMEKTSDKDKRKIELHSGLGAVWTGENLQISWGRVFNADGYSVYVRYCGEDFGAKPLNQVKSGKKTKITIKKINGKKPDTTRNFKFYVVAWQWKNGKKYTLAKTLIAHIAGKDSVKYTNVKNIRLKKTSYTLKKGGTVTLHPKAVLYDKRKKQLSAAHTKEFRYLSSNKKVALVTAGGKIKAKGLGSCTIFVFAKNGCKRKIKIKVK